MGRQPSFLDASLRIEGIVEILTLVCKKPVYFKEMVRKSKIKFKKSFMKYLRYCYEKGFVKKTEKHIYLQTIAYSKKYYQGHDVVFYSITKKGKNFLELLK